MDIIGLLGLLFIGLKLTNSIEWSWWLVLLPWYGVPLIVLFVMFVGVLAENTTKPKRR